ncbi:MAG: cyclic nucleotide-binding domain-containing protein [Acidobacteriia bacterium]|nr:cyclic nucleotide-binding domain-containing protein [Terriglobia bacterium]
MGPLCTECPVLKSVLFRGLTHEQITRLGCVFRPARYRRNQILFFEGGSAQHVFALHSGLVKVVKALENGKDRITRVLFPGELFGLEALTEATYPLTAVTLRDGEICAATRDEVLNFLRANPPETVSRTLSILRREQVLDARGRRLNIQDVAKLQAAAQR